MSDDDQWRGLTGVVLGLADPRLVVRARRLDAQDEIDDSLAAWTRTQDADAAMDLLQRAGVPAAVVRSPDEVLACSQLAARRWFRRLTHADVGEHDYNGPPWRFAGVDPAEPRPPPRLGEHTRTLLKERLGLSDGEIDSLIAADATGALLESEASAEAAS